MKILQINSVCGIRSTGRICTDIADVARQQGHECLIAYGREMVPDTYADISIRTDSPFGVKSHALQSRIFDNAGFARKKATKKLIRQIENFAPDIIHLHNLHGYYINVQVLFQFLKEYKRPVVWTLHDCWAFTGHCTHFDRIGCYKWKDECDACPQKRRYPASYVLDSSRKNFLCKKELFQGIDNMVIVTPSQWLASLAGESFLKKYPILTIPNGIDLSAFCPVDSNFREKYGLKDKKIILGVASAWGKNKGIDDFAALSRVVTDDYKIVIVGMNDRRAAQMPDNVLVIPQTDNVKELAEIYTAADVFFNPSKQETMGLTTVEAMACGTPVITSNLTAVPEVVSEESGIVLDDLSPDTVLAAINRILAGGYARTRERAENYEKSNQYLEYLTVYKTLYEGLL